MAKIIMFKDVYLCLSIAIMYDTVALFLIYKHVDGCSFFELMLQYVPVNDFSLLSGRFSVFLS